MDYAYTFGDPTTLYLNVTNRCTNSCTFCVRRHTDELGSGRLAGGPEPSLDDLLEAVSHHGGAGDFDEIVWCGFGEPTFRLDLLVEAGEVFRDEGARVRLNTNGHGCRINGRDVLPDLAAVVDIVSVSLNAPTAERYLELCRPSATDDGVAGRTPSHWESTVDFLARAPAHFDEVQATVVGHVLTTAEVASCEVLVEALGCPRLRVR